MAQQGSAASRPMSRRSRVLVGTSGLGARGHPFASNQERVTNATMARWSSRRSIKGKRPTGITPPTLSCNCRLAGPVPLLSIPSCSIDLIGNAGRRLTALRNYRESALNGQARGREIRRKVRYRPTCQGPLLRQFTDNKAAGHQLDARSKRPYGLHRRLARPFAGKQHAGGTHGFDDHPSQRP